MSKRIRLTRSINLYVYSVSQPVNSANPSASPVNQASDIVRHPLPTPVHQSKPVGDFLNGTDNFEPYIPYNNRIE